MMLNNKTEIKGTTLSVIMPVYNEANSIDEIIRRVKTVTIQGIKNKEIIIVNDASTDGTAGILKDYACDPQIKLITKKKNMGKSECIRSGIEEGMGDIIIIQDADLEYDPANYAKLIEPIIDDRAAIVYGSRFKGEIKNMKLTNRIANLISNLTLNVLYGTSISDVNTGHKAFKREVFRHIKISSDYFTFETEVTAKAIRSGYKIYEIPINYSARSKTEGKKITWLLALKMYWGIIQYRFINNPNA